MRRGQTAGDGTPHDNRISLYHSQKHSDSHIYHTVLQYPRQMPADHVLEVSITTAAVHE